MSVVLGISALYHDAAAVLVVDGEICAALQEERLSRIKNDASIPFRAAHACLRIAGLTVDDIDHVVYYENPYAKLERVLLSIMRAFPRSWRQFPRALASQLGSKLWVIDQIAEGLKIDRNTVEFVSHHQSHAASAFYCSPYENAAILVVDAVGEHSSTSIWSGQGSTLHAHESIDYPHSIGLFYAALTAFLGFRVNEGEYKVMGLAAYGTDRYHDEFSKLLIKEKDGTYKLNLRYFAHHLGVERGFSGHLESLLGPSRQPGKAWDLTTKSDKHYADVAATLQAVTENTMLALARRAYNQVGSPCLCLAGGVALNCVSNARILTETKFERVFVQPAAGDAGGAMGAALLGALEAGDSRGKALETAAFGIPVDVKRAYALATELGFTVRRIENPAEVVAESLVAKGVVGVATGRSEWGPRALGQRSILALPQEEDVRLRLNRVVKERELFRPFAPAVTNEGASEYFQDTANDMTPFMTTVCKVRDSKLSQLGAVTHKDHTARVQSVSAQRTPEFHALLTAVKNLNGTPVVLNTSLNGSGQPMAASETDALAFLCNHSIDALLIDDLWIERPS